MAQTLLSVLHHMDLPPFFRMLAQCLKRAERQLYSLGEALSPFLTVLPGLYKVARPNPIFFKSRRRSEGPQGICQGLAIVEDTIASCHGIQGATVRPEALETENH